MERRTGFRKEAARVIASDPFLLHLQAKYLVACDIGEH
jgi:hypothetical protein